MWTILVLATVCFTVVSAQYQTYDYCMEDVDALGGNYTFQCECDDYPSPANTTRLFWIIPDLTNLAANETHSGGKIIVSADLYELYIYDVQFEDLGTYFCVVNTQQNVLYMQKFGLNTKGPYFEDLLEKYTMNIILGFTGLFSFLISAAYVWVIYKFNWEKREGAKVDPAMGSRTFELETITSELPIDKKPVAEIPNGATNGDIVIADGDGLSNGGYQDDKEEVKSARL